MPKFKVAVSGNMLVEVEAKDEDEAADLVYENEEAGVLANMEVLEIVPANKPLEQYTDLE